MKNKILFRLFRYFALSLCIFAVVAAAIYLFLHTRHNVEYHRAELIRQTAQTAEVLSSVLETGTSSGMGGGLGSYLRFIENVTMNEVWVIEHSSDEITFSLNHTQQNGLMLRDLPYEATQVVSGALNGITSLTESFNTFMDASTITAAAPIIGSGGDIIGVALVHSKTSNANDDFYYSIEILTFSIMTAILSSIFMAFFLSMRFTKPLEKMKEAALLIYGGDYSAKTNVEQSDEIGELASVLDDMAKRLDVSSQESAKLDKLRRDFVANVSHELRTPITVIRSSSEAICDGMVIEREEILEYNNQIFNESIYLERLVSDLLDLARLQNPDFAIEMQSIDLKNVVGDVVRSMRRIAEQKNVQLAFACNDEDFMTVGDYGRLRQMIMIILDNAIKFSPENKPIDIAISKSVDIISITVRDKGCGIRSDDLPHIFERFYKQRTEQNKTGTGLGLAITKQIADRHNAIVSVISNESSGCEFVIKFKEFVLAQN
ncbi:MAG: HAMP domain-containing histidine kinase [Defluviitaleaceae bacterium]|nr:HAMP domain-containing histidine kinase [Defluviitaleaceae bacterium]